MSTRDHGRELDMADAHQVEVDENYDEFQNLLPDLKAVYPNKFALMKNRKILGFYSSAADASTAGLSFISDGIYSVQQVTDAAIDLGFYNNAVPVD